jgi:membrane associated rhomboid family serine protease
MKKTVLISFVIALVVVNLAGWVIQTYTEVNFGMAIRIPVILGITFIAAIFGFAALLVSKATKEKPR